MQTWNPPVQMSTASSIGHLCPYCGMGHSGVCSRVRAIEYHENGAVRRVEFHEPTPLPYVSASIKPIIVPSKG